MRVFRHRFRNGIVEAEIQRLKLVSADRRLLLNRQLRDHLANIPVPANDLPDGETHPKKVVTVPGGALADLLVVHRVAGFGDAEGLPELIQKDGDAVPQLHVRRLRNLPGSDARSRKGVATGPRGSQF
jgi:hypothetical protein